MGYVALKGGADAIAHARVLVEFYRLREQTPPLTIQQVKAQMRLAVDKVMGEGGLYAPEYAAIALKQSEGEVFEAAFILRAFITTLQRRYYSETLDTREMFIRRKISASFREIPGGQVLGPTRDYTQRLLDTSLAAETEETVSAFLAGLEAGLAGDPDGSAKASDGSAKASGGTGEVSVVDKVIDLLRREDLLRPVNNDEDRTLKDITREAIRFPAPRSARLQMMARAETGGLMALGYSSLRGFGNTHPIVGELRYGAVPIRIKDPSGRIRYIGRIEVTEAEMVTEMASGKKNTVPHFTMGYGLCFGQNDTKAINMGILDRSMRSPDGRSPATDQEFVLYHTEGVEGMGFTNHLKLPHYVSFQASLSNVRAAMRRADATSAGPVTAKEPA